VDYINLFSWTIYYSIKGSWSRSGYAYKPSYDIIIQAMNGCPQLVRGPPVKASFALTDIFTAYNAVSNILTIYTGYR